MSGVWFLPNPSSGLDVKAGRHPVDRRVLTPPKPVRTTVNTHSGADREPPLVGPSGPSLTFPTPGSRGDGDKRKDWVTLNDRPTGSG